MKKANGIGVEIGSAGALLASLQAEQQAVKQSDGLPSAQLVERLGEWQLLVADLAKGAKRGAELATLYEVTQVINSSLDLTETLNLVMDLLIHLTGAERV